MVVYKLIKALINTTDLVKVIFNIVAKKHKIL